MNAIEALKTRTSVRAYQARVVKREILEDIVDCGRLAASAMSRQPCEFVAVTDPVTLAEIAAEAARGKFIEKAPACIAVLCKETRFFVEDGSAATQNILVAARAHGLGACWVTGEKEDYADRVRELLGAPPSLRLFSLVPMGYPAESPSPLKRPLDEVLHWERY